jgi:hypothetical protein
MKRMQSQCQADMLSSVRSLSPPVWRCSSRGNGGLCCARRFFDVRHARLRDDGRPLPRITFHDLRPADAELRFEYGSNASDSHIFTGRIGLFNGRFLDIAQVF